MHKLTVIVAITLLALNPTWAQSRKAKSRPDAAITNAQELPPDLAALREAQRTWPGRPLCDDGGYRIRPCGLGAGGAGGGGGM
jgi:hypothetical protein